ncbi:MAG TPA: SPOR domain-containing protein, partial [Gammaproteobacteria bacterium]|nr:SPOR domain-containing protein [Gammaproteobacteria bacterium]
MIRILFVFFLLLNAAYFYLQFDAADAPASSSILKEPPLPAGVGRLVLLRERGLGISKSPLPTARPESPPVQNVKSKPPKVVANVPAAPSREPPAAPPVAKTREPACFTLGPFTKESIMQRTAKALLAWNVEVRQRDVTRRIPKGYWVYLPPSKSYQAAKRKVEALRKKGLTDLFIMGKGSRKNAISLGLFKRKSTAEERFQQVKKLGLKAVLETQYRRRKQHWLDMKVADGKIATVAAITEIADGLPQAELTQ